MLKPAFKSLEGQSVTGVIVGSLFLLYQVLTGGEPDTASVELMLSTATEAKEIAQAYAASVQTETLSELGSLGKTSAILVFVYKIWAKFNDGRIELKKAAAKGGSDEPL